MGQPPATAPPTGHSDRGLIEELRTATHALGFDAFGIAPVSAIDQAGVRLREFLNAGRHGDMNWMAETAERRSSPKHLWPDAVSAIVVGHNYGPERDPMADLAHKERAVISAYAKGKDYHDVLKGRLKQLAQTTALRTGADVKVFVDTAPLMEKPLAAAAGIGWQGKHTNLVSLDFGSWLFLGVILTTAELPSSTPMSEHCGTCRRCLDVCPTDAFPAPYQLDARRCIAYLTIEARGQIQREFRRPIGNRVFGCDDCLAVCPWNKFAQATSEVRYKARVETDNPAISELIGLTDAQFRKRFSGTPVKRTGRDRIVRNALVAAGNSGEEALIEPATARLGDDSPLVRAMAVWALSQLCAPTSLQRLAAQWSVRETDPGVLAEWALAVPDTRNASPEARPAKRETK